MSKITDSAEGRNCTARIPGVCSFNPTHTVWAHIRSIRFKAGMRKKPPDVIGLYACSECHDVIDGRVKTNHGRDFIKACRNEGHLESMLILLEEGLIHV